MIHLRWCTSTGTDPRLKYWASVGYNPPPAGGAFSSDLDIGKETGAEPLLLADAYI